MCDAELKGDDDGADSRFYPILMQQPSPALISSSHIYHNNSSYNQAVNFNPSILSFYPGNQYPSSSLSPCFLSNAHVSPTYLTAPGLPQYASSPGFITGAGFQFNVGSPHLAGLHLHGSFLPPGQAGMPLHAAAIVGDKQKIIELLQDESTNLECRDRWGRVALVYAVLGNHHEIVEILLQAGARPDATDAQKCTPLHFAAYKGSHGCIKSLLHAVEIKATPQGESQGGVWLVQDMRGVTPLHHAAHHTNQKCLQALLKYASPGTLDTVDHKKRTSLHWAAAYGSDENCKLLIKHGANNLMPDQEGKTPLHWAAVSKAPGAKGCVRTLIGAAPSSVNWQDFDGITALHLAVAEARQDAVDVILSVPKCNVDLTDNQFRTALHWACNRGVTTIVGRLLDRGAHLGAVDVYGATPLHYAAQLNHAETVELLVRRPCVRDDPSKEGHTALLWAAARGADLAITAMVRHGASLTKADPRGCTPLHIAAGAGHVSTVGVLLRLRAPPDVCASDGRTPLLHAAQAGHAHIVKLLAKAGASLDHRDNEGQCALHHAVLSGHLYLAQILIRAGTSVNVQDYSGRTPLHMAAYRGLSDIMFLLLENRGDINARDHEGQSPLHWAAQQGHLGAVNTLLDFHAYPNYTQTTVNRYTPLDCAYVAEQLEIAQVLMEAGGLSVTKIMDIAASRIQAMIRGYLTRIFYKKLKLSLKNEKNPKGNLIQTRPDYSDEIACNFLDAVISKTNVHSLDVKRFCDSETIFEDLSTGDSIELINKEKDALKDRILPINQALECVPDAVAGESNAKNLHHSKPSSESVSSKFASKNRSSPDKTGPHRRRSKIIANSIKLGARKKTVRELELPAPGELGIEDQAVDSSNNVLDNSLNSDDDCAVLTQTVQNPSLVMGQALQYPRNVASALITINVGHLEAEKSIEDKYSKVLTETSCSKNDDEMEFEYEKCTDYTDQDQHIHQENCSILSDTDSKYEKNYKDSCRNENKNSTYIEDKQVFKSTDKNIHLKTSECHSIWQSVDDLEPSLYEEQLRQLNKKERKKLLEEKIAKSLEVAHKEADTTSSNNNRSHGRHILNAGARKLAEEKWNSKLATLTLQVQRPSSAKSATSFSYNLVSPTSSAQPATKNVQFVFPEK